MLCGFTVDHTGAYVATGARTLSKKQKGSSGSALAGQGVERPAAVKGRVSGEVLRVETVTQCGE